jgi:hypothetical protein
MNLLLIFLLIVVLGCGGGYYGYQWGGAPVGALPLLAAFIAAWILFGR